MATKKSVKKTLKSETKSVKKSSAAKTVTKQEAMPEKTMKKKSVKSGRILTAEGWRRAQLKIHKSKKMKS